MIVAASKGHLEIVKWLHEHRSEGCTVLAMDMAASEDHLDIVQFLHENRSEGCTFRAMDCASSVQVLEWLHEHRTGCTVDATMDAVCGGNFEKLLFLYEKNLLDCSDDVVDHAVRRDCFEIPR